MSNPGALMGMGGAQPAFMTPGSAARPGLLTGNRSGFYPIAGGGVGYAVAGVEVWRIGADGRVHATHRTFFGQPPGTVIWFAASTEPEGTLECDGALYSRATYAALFAVTGITFGAGDGSTTFRIPDLRGYFIRGWDNGAGVDIGRVFGAAQADEFRSHFHLVGQVINFAGSVQMLTGSGSAGLANSTTAAGGAETRPFNVALLPCIVH